MKYMSQIKFSCKRLLRPLCLRILGNGLQEINFPTSIRVQSPDKTIKICKKLIANKEKGAYLRFGDGDVNLLNGHGDMLQPCNAKLRMEMKEAFNLQGTGIIKSLSLHSPRFGIWPGMAPGIHASDDRWTERLLSRCYPFFIGTPIYTSVALAYLAAFNQPIAIDFLRFLKGQKPIFVGNNKIPGDLLQKLFGKTIHIKTPEHNSYSEINRIEQETVDCVNQLDGEYKVIVSAMGCSGRIFAKRIYNREFNVFLFDFGSLLDALCGWNTRAWMEIAPYDVKKLLEQI